MANGTPAQGETARQIAEQVAWHATGECGCCFMSECEAMREHLVASHVASLTAALAQARQEIATMSEKRIHTSDCWLTTRADLADTYKQLLTAAEQARDEALARHARSCSCICHEDSQLIARTALLEAAEDAKALSETPMGQIVLHSWATFATWLTTRAGGPRT